MPDIDCSATFQDQATILHDFVFMSGSDAESDRFQASVGLSNGFNGFFKDIVTDHAMAVAGIRKHPFGVNVEFAEELLPHGWQVIVSNMADLTDGHGVYRDQNGRFMIDLQYQSFCK